MARLRVPGHHKAKAYLLCSEIQSGVSFSQAIKESTKSHVPLAAEPKASVGIFASLNLYFTPALQKVKHVRA